MKRVGVREFRDHATKYLHGEEAVTIERNGEPIGIYIPTGGAERKKRAAEAMARLERTVERVLAETGMTEDELSRLWDLSVPIEDVLDELPDRRRDGMIRSSNAAGG